MIWKTVPCISLVLCAAAVVAGQAQAPKMKSLLLHGGYSFHGSGDFLGGQGGVAYESQVYKWLSLRYQADVTMHGGSAIGYVRSDQFYQQEPMYELTTGVQLAAMPVVHVLGAGKPWLNIAAGPLLRYQLSSSPNSYAYQSNAGTLRPDYYSIYDVTPRGIYIGYTVAVESQFIHTKKWAGGIRAHFQNDTNGDVITGISLVWRRKLITAAQTTGVN
jgi:hypothetical protein